jgi:hypothetical protein
VVEAEWAAETTHRSHVLRGPVEPIIETLLICMGLRLRGAHPASEQSHDEHDDGRARKGYVDTPRASSRVR